MAGGRSEEGVMEARSTPHQALRHRRWPGHLRDLFADDPGRGETHDRSRSATSTSTTRSTASPPRRCGCCVDAGRAGRAATSAIDAMFAGEKINVTEDRAVLHVALRAPRDGSHRGRRRRTSSPRCTRCSTRWPASPSGSAAGRGPGTPGERIRNVVNIGIGGSDLGPAMAYEALRDFSDRDLTVPVRLQHRRHRLLGGDRATSTRPRRCSSSSSKTFTTLETMTNARTARDWLLAAPRRRRRPSPSHFVAVSTNADEVAEFGIDTGQHVRASGTGSAAATPTTRRSGLSLMIADRPRAVPRDAGRLPRHGRALPHRAVRAQPAGAAGPDRRLVRRLLRRRDPGRAALQPVPRPLPGLPPAARHGEQRQVGRPSTASRSTCQTGPIVWGQPGTNGQHAYYQLIHQGTKLIPADFIGFVRAGPRRRRPPRPADGQLLRPDRGAGLRQDARDEVRGRGRARRTRCRTGPSPATTRPPRSSPPELTPRRAGPARRALRAQGLHPGRRSGTSTPSTSGASSWARSWPTRIMPELTSAAAPAARPRHVDQRARSAATARAHGRGPRERRVACAFRRRPGHDRGANPATRRSASRPCATACCTCPTPPSRARRSWSSSTGRAGQRAPGAAGDRGRRRPLRRGGRRCPTRGADVGRDRRRAGSPTTLRSSTGPWRGRPSAATPTSAASPRAGVSDGASYALSIGLTNGDVFERGGRVLARLPRAGRARRAGRRCSCRTAPTTRSCRSTRAAGRSSPFSGGPGTPSPTASSTAATPSRPRSPTRRWRGGSRRRSHAAAAPAGGAMPTMRARRCSTAGVTGGGERCVIGE